MKEFQFEGKWRQFITEGQSDFVAKEMEKDLGVLVAPPSHNPFDDTVAVYPGLKPGDDRYIDRTNDRITLRLGEEGGTKLVSIYGNTKGLDLIGMPYNSTKMVGFGIVMPPSTERPEVDYDDIKTYIIQLRRGAEAEAEAQRDFYKDWVNPD